MQKKNKQQITVNKYVILWFLLTSIIYCNIYHLDAMKLSTNAENICLHVFYALALIVYLIHGYK